MAAKAKASHAPMRRVYRHSVIVRITHWFNLLVITILLMSGLQIFNAHPALYWGSRSDPDRALLSMSAQRSETGELRGLTRVLGVEFETTGLFGVSKGAAGEPLARGFPAWATVPSDRWLAMGRRWHFFFAWLFVINGAVYAAYAIGRGHLRRDLLPSGGEVRGVRSSLRSHLSIRRLRSEASHGYNLLQKTSYLLVVFVLGPLVVLTGLTMSPWLDAAFPGLLTIFDGRQSARTIHFLVAFAFVAFTLVHVTMVLLVGPVNHLRAMITGRLRIPGGEP